MNIFVGNLSFDATKADVRKAFECFGSIASVVIVMDKKGAKSRGFGFVEMLDEQQAQAAIAALAGKEFMGRPLNVSPAHPKSEAGRDSGKRKKMRPQIKAEAQQYPREEKDQKNARFNPVFHKIGGYKKGRRSRGFMMRRTAAGIKEQAMPQRKSQENPMRWRKKQKRPRSLQKNQEQVKPWRKTEGKPKSWRKSNERPQQSRLKRRKKSGGYKKER